GGEQAFEPGHHVVEVVEGAERHEAHRPAFRRPRIDVVEMLEARRILEVAVERHTMPPLRRRVLRAYRCRGHEHLAEQGGNGGKRGGAKDRAAGQAQGKPPGNGAGGMERGDARCPIWSDRRLTSAGGCAIKLTSSPR